MNPGSNSAGVVHALASVDLHFEDGVVLARQRAREVAALLGFDTGAQTRIATAVSELARNAHRYAGGGIASFSVDGQSLLVEVSDRGQGIPDLNAVLSGSYRSTTGMGQGLVGVRRLMDSFDIETSVAGTRVRASKLLPSARKAAPDSAQLRAELARGSARSAYDEVQAQNQELLHALNELRSRQEELLHLNLELEATNRGVVALYAELDERAEQLRDADNKKSRFLADMSHELRTPLNSIVALTELLSEGPDTLTSEQRTQVEYIRRMATDQLQLVGELLDLAKIEAGRAEIALSPVSIPELFALLRTQLRPLAAGSQVALVFSSEPHLPQLVTDERKLIHVLRNLVGNALKYTREGEVLVSAAAAGDMLELSVTDTGVGIAASDLERIFDEFVQVDGEHQRRVQGTGLGLPLARKLTTLLGGRIEVSSTAGVGSRFAVTLPWRWPDAAAAGVVPGVQATAAVPESGAAGATPDSSEAWRIGLVLVADDDTAARYIVRQHLEGLVGEVVEAAGGSEALEILSTRHPSAVVLDLSMPDIGGLEVLALMRAIPELEDTPVLIHTSKELDSSERREIERHGAAVVMKGEASATRLLTTILERRSPE